MPVLCLGIINLEQVLLENLTGKRGFQIPDAFFGQVRIFADRVGDDMHMGMMSLVVECRIPSQIFCRNFHAFSDFVCLAAKQIPPSLPGFITQTGSIFTAKGYDICPYAAFMRRDFCRDLIEIYGDIGVRKQSMGTESLRSGAICNVAHIVIPCADPVEVIFDRSVNETGCVSFGFGSQIILILITVFCFREIRKQLSNELLLTDGGALVLPRIIDLIDTIPLGNVFHKILRVVRHSGLQVETLENDLCHRKSLNLSEISPRPPAVWCHESSSHPPRSSREARPENPHRYSLRPRSHGEAWTAPQNF